MLLIETKKTRTDYLENFEIMIAEYNAGSKNVDLIYKDLVDLDYRKTHLKRVIPRKQHNIMVLKLGE